MKKLEEAVKSTVNYVNTAPFWNCSAIFFAAAATNNATDGDWEMFAMNSIFLALEAGLGYWDFVGYKKIKTELEKGWDEEKVDIFINKEGGLFSRYLVRRAAEQTGYGKEFNELAKRKNYRLLSILNSCPFLAKKSVDFAKYPAQGGKNKNE